MTPESQSLSGRSVFITGAARRIGAAIATELHAAGM
ncbi:MAG: pteridine reductase, partial [Gammaproteobacteria bacterium]|nr:pteridine reductase [Gammaproteobacteria bacterium]